MALKDLLVVAAARADQFVLDYGASVACQMGSHLGVLLVGWKPHVPIHWLNGPAEESLTEAVAAAAKALRDDQARLVVSLGERVDRLHVQSVLLKRPDARRVVARHARCADITFVGRPDVMSLGDLHTPFIEGALFGSGRPIMVVPPDWRGKARFDKVVICWKDSRESSRAAFDALPFIEAAQEVTLLTVSDEGPGEIGSSTDIEDILASIRRHNPRATSRALPGSTVSDAEILLGEIKAVGADLVVMGGYGHSRMSELVLGGATRDMLANCPVPLFMSH